MLYITLSESIIKLLIHHLNQLDHELAEIFVLLDHLDRNHVEHMYGLVRLDIEQTHTSLFNRSNCEYTMAKYANRMVSI